jgi:hypothetical protein
MLEARIVAARIQPAEDFGHGNVEGPARITPSLQGSRIIVVIVGDASSRRLPCIIADLLERCDEEKVGTRHTYLQKNWRGSEHVFCADKVCDA